MKIKNKVLFNAYFRRKKVYLAELLKDVESFEN